MSAPQQSSTRNQLLVGLPAEDFAALQSRLEPVELELRQVLIEPNQPITHVYFPSTATRQSPPTRTAARSRSA